MVAASVKAAGGSNEDAVVAASVVAAKASKKAGASKADALEVAKLAAKKAGAKGEDMVKAVGVAAASLSMDEVNGGVVGDERVLADVSDAIVVEAAKQGLSVEKASELAAAVVRDAGGSDEDANV